MNIIEKAYKGRPYSLRRVVTERYIWHVTRRSHRQSILSIGLLPVHGLLFANNQNTATRYMWHWDLEFCESPGIEALMHDGDMVEKYCLDARLDLDFWRIDTKYAGVQWYQDPAMDGWRTVHGEDISHRYVCSPSAVAPSAIRLFTFDNREHDRVRVRELNGVTHCAYSSLPLRMVG